MTQLLVYDIPDMHCKQCAKVLRLALGFTAGVEKTEISLENLNASISIDPRIISKTKIKAIIVALGFSAMLL